MELSVENLACRRGGRHVFTGLSFAVVPGEPMTLRGPNGAGKSTLLRTLAGFLPISAGDARLGQASLAKSSQDMQDLVLYAGHLDAVKPALTVTENLAFWSSLHGTKDKPVADSALERFGLSAIAQRPAAECSAGQRRRLGIARLLLTERPLWLLDEPTVSLDAASSALVADLIREHAAKGGLTLVASHIDLGLGAGPELCLDPEPATARTAPDTDPFLEGQW
ncbi:MAG: heme ABC exporter ATP-binding protein CcmA [Pseudomonadota bacterium]